MRIPETFLKIIPAASLAAVMTSLTFAPAHAQMGGAMPAGGAATPVIIDSASSPTDTVVPEAKPKAKVKGDAKAGAPRAKSEGTVKKTAPAATKSEATKAKTPTKTDAHKTHGAVAHRADSMPKDTTLILGTPGSPTTQGVPGTGVQGGR